MCNNSVPSSLSRQCWTTTCTHGAQFLRAAAHVEVLIIILAQKLEAMLDQPMLQPWFHLEEDRNCSFSLRSWTSSVPRLALDMDMTTKVCEFSPQKRLLFHQPSSYSLHPIRDGPEVPGGWGSCTVCWGNSFFFWFFVSLHVLFQQRGVMFWVEWVCLVCGFLRIMSKIEGGLWLGIGNEYRLASTYKP